MPTLYAPDEAATNAIGAAIASHLAPGDVVTLDGDLGTGKTALARAIIRAWLHEPDLEVPSPSFAMVQPYRGLLHADLYRLSDEAEIEELGLLDEESSVLLVEWPQRAPGLFARPGLRIAMAMGQGESDRLLTIEAIGRQAENLFAALAPWQHDGSQ